MATTVELKRWQKEGALIVTRGSEEIAAWEPRQKGDRRPWIVRNSWQITRYRAADLKAITPNGGGPWVVARLVQL